MARQITDAEFEIMSILWDDAPLAASEIAERLQEQTSWSIKTIKTLLSRLTEKDVLSHEQDGRRYLYSPLISRTAYEKKATRRFAEHLFNGRAAPLVAHLADGDGLSVEDIKELETLVEELKRDRS